MPTAEFSPARDFRIGVVFDDTIRKDTTGRYALKYLSQWCRATHLAPQELPHVSREEFDLFLHIDDGLGYVLPSSLYPRAIWLIDTHLNFAADFQRAQSYDWVFVAQRKDAEAMRSSGVFNVWWLPLAGDPDLAVDTEIRWDWSFIGHWDGPLFEERRRIIAAAQAVGNYYVGQADPEAMYRIYGSSRAVLNVPVRDDLNMRVFEAMAAGTVVVTKRLRHSGMDQLFEEGVHYLGYDTDEEAVSALQRVIVMSPERRNRMVEEIRRLAIQRDSYRCRMGALLEVIFKHPGMQAQYYRHARQEILDLVPTSAGRILDVGCATGVLGKLLKARQRCHVTGIERHAGAAEVARGALDEVVEADVLEALSGLPDDSYDCIVAADVLEHTTDPWAVLKKLARKLRRADDSCLVLSLPNVSHWTVVFPLLTGEWRYLDAGIQDVTHLRFFTPSSAERLIRGAGLKVNQTLYSVLPLPEQYHPQVGESLLVGWQRQLANIYQMIYVCGLAR